MSEPSQATARTQKVASQRARARTPNQCWPNVPRISLKKDEPASVSRARTTEDTYAATPWRGETRANSDTATVSGCEYCTAAATLDFIFQFIGRIRPRPH